MKQTKDPARKFPTFAVVVIVVGIIWLLNDLNIFQTNIPWFPILVVVVGIGMVTNHVYHGQY